MEPTQFLEELSSYGESSVTKVIRDLQNELIIQQLQQIQVPQRIQITDAEVDSFLVSAEGQMWSAPELLLQHIFLDLPSTAGPSEVSLAEETMARVIREFDSGSDFGNLAVQYSSSQTALDGGQIGWRRGIEFAPEIGVVLEEVNPGDIAGPVRGAGGIHLFLVSDVRGGDETTMVQQTQTRHILIRPNEIRSETDARELIDLIAGKLEDGETFQELARTYSDDVANALDGGDLGWVLPGQMVPEFESATDATATGETSAPVQTAFGWHILKVEDRRDVDMSDDIMRQQATNVIGSQRFEEELDLWIRELRSEAFIQILEN
jgi:peptidyl-prolyl cis-trans isomerase SurA